ncbi:hypothetical protein ACA910_017522 [Epithemia clementina (nom. ined.)]
MVNRNKPPGRPSEKEEGPCFCFFENLHKQLRTLVGGENNDPIGTPLPDTPQVLRRRREQVKDAFLEEEDSDDQNGSGDSDFKYLGLEQGSGKQNARPTTQVYEGRDSEKRLRAKYELLEVMGVGSTSAVHRCRNRKTRKEYACKIIDCKLIEQRFRGMMAQFRTEIDALRQLDHPGIIRLFDVFISREKIYIVMELMEGGELFDYVVQKGTLTEEEAARIVRKVTGALVYMHEMNIIHRDLKPENLLLKKKPTAANADVDVKIIDFGLSKAMEEPVARTFLGTRGYLAPEILQRRDYTRAVDSWALGVIVFVLLCGCLPFDDDSTVPSDDLVKAKFVLRFPRWAKNLSPSSKDLLAHLLDVNPRTRYTAEQALAHPWVQGETAPSNTLLASPRRIKRNTVEQNPAVGVVRDHAKARQQNELQADPGPPAARVVRKKSF